MIEREPRPLTTAEKIIIYDAEIEKAKAWQNFYLYIQPAPFSAAVWTHTVIRLKQERAELMAQEETK